MTNISFPQPISFKLAAIPEKIIQETIVKKKNDPSQGSLYAKDILYYSAATCIASLSAIIATVEVVASAAFSLFKAAAVMQAKNISDEEAKKLIYSINYCLVSLSSILQGFSGIVSPSSKKAPYDLRCRSVEIAHQTIKAQNFVFTLLGKNNDDLKKAMHQLNSELFDAISQENKTESQLYSEILKHRLNLLKEKMNSPAQLPETILDNIKVMIEEINQSEIPSHLTLNTVSDEFCEFIIDILDSFQHKPYEIDQITQSIVENTYKLAPEFFAVVDKIDPATGRPLDAAKLPLDQQMEIGQDLIIGMDPASLVSIANLVQLTRAMSKEPDKGESFSNFDTASLPSDFENLSINEKKLLITKLLPTHKVDEIIDNLPQEESSRLMNLYKRISRLGSELIQPSNEMFNEGYQNACTTL